jgi:hypothetical protein
LRNFPCKDNFLLIINPSNLLVHFFRRSSHQNNLQTQFPTTPTFILFSKLPPSPSTFTPILRISSIANSSSQNFSLPRSVFRSFLHVNLHCPTFRGHKKVKLKFLLFQHPQPELHKNHVTQFANKVKRGKIHNEANDNFIQLFDMFLPSIFLVSLIGRSVFDVPLLIIFLLGHAQSEDKFNFIVLRALKKDENLIIP